MASVGWSERGQGALPARARHGGRLLGLGHTTLQALRRVTWRTVAHWVLLAAAVGYLAWRIPGMAAEFARATGQVADMRWGLVAVAALTGVTALAAYGELHRQLLLVGGARLAVRDVQAISFAQNAISATVPVVGGTGSLGYAIDQFRRRGASAALAGWAVLMAGVITTVTLLILGALGLAWAGRLPASVAIVAAAVVGFGSAGVWLLLTHPAALHRDRPRRPAPDRRARPAWMLRLDTALRQLVEQVAVLRPGGGRWAALLGLALSSWVLDFLTLVTSAAAAGARVTPAALAVAFLVVQASIALQVLPGGAGLAEASLLGILVGAGVSPAIAAATTVTYRLISWLGMSVVGWAGYALYHPTRRDSADAGPLAAAQVAARPEMIEPERIEPDLALAGCSMAAR